MKNKCYFLYANVRHEQRERNRITNLLQENIKMESQRTNSTFGFCRHVKKPTLKNKRAIFPKIRR